MTPVLTSDWCRVERLVGVQRHVRGRGAAQGQGVRPAQVNSDFCKLFYRMR